MVAQVRNSAGGAGFVPASYLKPGSKKAAPGTAAPVAASPAADYNSAPDAAKRVVRAVYPYAAQRIDELTVQARVLNMLPH